MRDVCSLRERIKTAHVFLVLAAGTLGECYGRRALVKPGQLLMSQYNHKPAF
jgi:hypothetical protein